MRTRTVRIENFIYLSMGAIFILASYILFAYEDSKGDKELI